MLGDIDVLAPREGEAPHQRDPVLARQKCLVCGPMGHSRSTCAVPIDESAKRVDTPFPTPLPLRSGVEGFATPHWTLAHVAAAERRVSAHQTRTWMQTTPVLARRDRGARGAPPDSLQAAAAQASFDTRKKAPSVAPVARTFDSARRAVLTTNGYTRRRGYPDAARR